MVEVVAEETSYLTDADREAIAAYHPAPEGTDSTPAPPPLAADTPLAGMGHSQMDMSNES